MRTAPRLARVEKTLVRPALWFCACNLLAAVLAAQCTNPTQVPNQTDTSGTYNYSDNNALSASNVVVSGSASMTLVAGNCIQLLPGFHATAGTAATTFHAWVEAAPADVSVWPSNGTGMNQSFTWAASSPSGYTNLSDIFALFNTSVSGANACYIHYNRNSNLLYLADNSGANWLGGFAPGSSGSAGNSYCSIYGSGSSVSGSGTQLALTVSVVFQSGFSGTKNEYLYAQDNAGLNTGWQQMGTWTVGNSGFTPIRISAGGPYTDSLGQYWAADYGYLQGSTYATGNTITGTADPHLYQTERWNDPTLTYQFSVPNGNYTVTLKFAEIYDTAAGQRYMNIALNGWTVITGLDVWTAAGGPDRAYDLNFPVTVTNGQLTITLTCTSPNNSGEVNSIQIVAAGSGTVATPTFSPAAGNYSSAQTVTISTTTSGATIRYTTDGSTPTPTTGTLYTGAITLASTTTLKAIAYETGWTNSAVASGTYTISQQVAAPTFSPAGGTYSSAQSVTITTTTPNATIRYTTDGSTPTESNGTIYSGAISVSSTMTIKAIAYEAGWTDSTVSSATYTISGAVVMPTFSPAGGAYTGGQSVTITTTTPNATIRYTTNGNNPTETYGTVYTGPISISTTTTLKAIAYESGLSDSTVFTAAYTIGAAAGAPTISPAAGTYTSPATITLTSSTPGASIRYTTDGSTPTETVGTLYSSAFTLSNAATIRAIAYATGWLDSSVSSAAFTFAAAAPTCQPPTGTYAPGQTVALSTTTPGASIRFTTDGSTPSETAGTLYASPIAVSNGMTIKAIAYLAGWIDSAITTETYTIQSGGSNSTTREYIRVNGRVLAFETGTLQTVATPTFSPGGGTYTTAQSVTISTTTPNATIRYTTDGTTPSETAGTIYGGPVYVASSMTVKAIAYESGWNDSSVSSAVYTMAVVTPTFSPGSGTYTTAQSVAISTTTPNATIRYTTDGSTPSETAGTIYTAAIYVGSSMTIKAIAYESGWTDSAVNSATYTITGTVVAPSFSPGGGTYTTAQSVTISTTTPNATIRYTTDGSQPSETAGTIYTGPITVAGSMTIKAIAYESGWNDSSISSAAYTITGTVATPAFSPGSGTYTAAQSVTISTTTPNATIRYTTDGSQPSETAGTVYTGPVNVNTSMTLKAIAYEAGWVDSGVSSATYTINDPVPTATEFIPTCYPCSAGPTGNPQQFTVQVEDNAGASAITYVQPFLSSDPNFQNFSNSCHLEYQASNNTLSLDSSSGNSSWVGYGTQGGAGGWVGSNVNGVCQVNSWSVSLSGNYLTLNVSLTFQTPGTWYYYMSATNATGDSAWVTNGLSWTSQ
jgi:AraC-like DNA-binding protein